MCSTFCVKQNITPDQDVRIFFFQIPITKPGLLNLQKVTDYLHMTWRKVAAWNTKTNFGISLWFEFVQVTIERKWIVLRLRKQYTRRTQWQMISVANFYLIWLALQNRSGKPRCKQEHVNIKVYCHKDEKNFFKLLTFWLSLISFLISSLTFVFTNDLGLKITSK